MADNIKLDELTEEMLLKRFSEVQEEISRLNKLYSIKESQPFESMFASKIPAFVVEPIFSYEIHSSY